MFRAITELIQREKFNPRFIGIFTNPFYLTRSSLYDNLKAISRYRRSGEKLLDVGCGSSPYKKLFEHANYTGVEINGSSAKADYYYDGKTLPFAGGTYDTVLCTEVLEHTPNPKEFLMEVRRVTRLGGRIILTVPFIWDEHEQPNDFTRYTSFGIIKLLGECNYKVVYHGKSCCGIRAVFQMLAEYIYKVTYVKNTILRTLLNALLISPVTILGIILSAILPKGNDLYLDNVVYAIKWE